VTIAGSYLKELKVEKSEELKRKLEAGKHLRQSVYAENELNLLRMDAKKSAWNKLSVLIKKYDISGEDVEEIIEVSPFLL
jgi:hypothetical protein